MRHTVVVALMGLLVATGCRYFATDRSIRERIDEAAIVGTWQLTPESLDLLTRDGFHTDRSINYEISFSQGGTCKFASALDLDRPTRYVVSECTWSLKHDTTCGSNITTKNAREILLLPSRAGYCLSFTRNQGNIVLWQGYGDPDSWEFLEYALKTG